MKKHRVLAWLVQILGCVIPAALMVIILVPIAFRIRGYAAFGGEWMIVLLAGAVGGLVTHQIMKARRERKNAGKLQSKRRFQMFTIQSEGERAEETAANF